jgi:hypothetical protein
MYIRQSSQPNEEQKRIYEALCIDPQAGERSEVYVWRKEWEDVVQVERF